MARSSNNYIINRHRFVLYRGYNQIQEIAPCKGQLDLSYSKKKLNCPEPNNSIEFVAVFRYFREQLEVKVIQLKWNTIENYKNIHRALLMIWPMYEVANA